MKQTHLTRRPNEWIWRSRSLSFSLKPRFVICMLLLAGLIAIAGLFTMTIGKVHIPAGTVLSILFNQSDASVMQQQILFNLRLPQTLTAIFTGAALGVSGAIFQSVSRNPLGSPDIIGFTMGAATGALLQIIFMGGGPLAVAISAVAGGVVTAGIVYLLSFKNGTTSGYRLVLVGIGAGATLSALNGLMLVKGDLDNAIAANLWLAGSLNARTWQHVLPLMIGCIVIIPLISLFATRLTMMEMGDDQARQLGIGVERTRLAMILCAVLLAGLATAAAGPIAFIALAAPQLVSRLTRIRGIPVISAALMGACLLVAAYLLIQLAAFRLILPVGRVTGLVGGLYLIWYLTQSRRI